MKTEGGGVWQEGRDPKRVVDRMGTGSKGEGGIRKSI